MDSVIQKKIMVREELGCSGVECVELVNVAPDLSLSWSGEWYACALSRDGYRLWSAKAKSPDAAMDFLITQVTAP
jgi:hypothetical protein